MGRATRIRKRTSHLTIALTPKEYLRRMGQKVHPESMRVGYIHDWKSNWFNERHFSDFLIEDVAHPRPHHRTSSRTPACRTSRSARTPPRWRSTSTPRGPGIVIGKSGSEVDALRRDLHRLTGKAIKVNILEIKRPELDAKLVAQSIAEQLANRVAFRRAMKRALTSAMRSGAKGCKIQVSGRLGGAEMARTEYTPTAACRCTRCARTSTTASTRPARRSAASA